jgi:hypothetical protein
MDHKCDFSLMIEHFMKGAIAQELFLNGFEGASCIFPRFYLNMLY